jgi:hypothetical protein
VPESCRKAGTPPRIRQRTQTSKRTQKVAAGGSPRCAVGVTRPDGRGALEGPESIKRMHKC